MNARKFPALLALMLCFVLCLGACAAKPSIVGSWETEAAVLNSPEGNDQTADNRVIFQFADDQTRKQTPIVNGTSQELDFTYTLSDGILRISFTDGPDREFPYVLENSQLILTQNHKDVIYQKNHKIQKIEWSSTPGAAPYAYFRTFTVSFA